MTLRLGNILRSGTSLMAASLVMGAAQFGGTTAYAQDAASTPAAGTDAEATQGEELIMVTGRRISAASETIGKDKITNTVSVTREALLSAPSGISGLKMLETLPGFNVQTDGPLGLYEFGNTVQARAFNLDQIGFVVDGVPLGRSDAFGGSPAFRYVDNENLANVEASVGAGDVSIPSYATLGPVVTYNSIKPQDDLGLFVSQSFGDDEMKRTFIRLSTGQVGPFKGYVSRTKLDSDLWRGVGTVNREHWEAQITADLGGDSWARLKFVSNDFKDYDSPFLLPGQFESTTPDIGGNTGRDIGYYDVPPPGTPGFEPTVTGVPYSHPNYAQATYALAINVRSDRLYAATVHGGLTDTLWAESTAYMEDKGGYGVSSDSYGSSLTRYLDQQTAGLNVTAPRGTQYGKSGVDGKRYGITAKLHWEFGTNVLEAGIWAEMDKYHRTQLRLNTTDGSPASAPVESEIVFYRRDYRSKRDTTQLFIKDTLSLMGDKLSLTVGIKSLTLNYQLNGYRDFADYYRVIGRSSTNPGIVLPGYGPQFNSAHYNDNFMPLIGALYKFDQRTQIFASYAENMALPKGMDDIFALTLSNGSGVVPAPAAEKSKNAELGIRTNQREFYAALAAYYTAFDNRIQQTASLISGSNSVELIFTNAGKVEAYGVEFAGSYKPAFLNGLAYFNLNATYNHAKFKDDIGGTMPAKIAGNYLPDSAKWVVNGGVTVEPASWLVANFSGKYTSKRFADLVNTTGLTVKGFTIFNAYVDIGDGIKVGPLKSVKARFNVDNVFDKKVLSFLFPIGTNFAIYRPQSPRTFQFTISAEY